MIDVTKMAVAVLKELSRRGWYFREADYRECSACGEELVYDARYCIKCGLRAALTLHNSPIEDMEAAIRAALEEEGSQDDN